jgi:hypothetical protein
MGLNRELVCIHENEYVVAKNDEGLYFCESESQGGPGGGGSLFWGPSISDAVAGSVHYCTLPEKLVHATSSHVQELRKSKLVRVKRTTEYWECEL